MFQCRYCRKTVHECPACKGVQASGMFGRLTCSTCNSTGQVCPDHGGNWK